MVKGNGPMGLSIVGGTDQACPPFGMDQRGVFVSKVNYADEKYVDLSCL